LLERTIKRVKEVVGDSVQRKIRSKNGHTVCGVVCRLKEKGREEKGCLVCGRGG
jgi:hypothetical protein